MTRPLIATKLYPPTLRRGLVARPGLVARIESGAAARLTLVSAPAGFGKTTTVSAWLHQASTAGRGTAWLTLDAADHEPASFWTYVATALQAAAPGVGSRALELLDTPEIPIDEVLTTLLNDLAAAPTDLWLVLDDFHLIDTRAIDEGVAFLVDHLPSQVHVVISTRADPGLPLARWRAGGELVEIRAVDLRFTSTEAATYLRAVTGLELAADDVAVLDERTEGWIAALQLAALSLRGREDASGFIARFAGDDRHIVDYLVEEVLRHQTDAVRRFLLQSAVLDRLTGPLCDAVTGGTDGSGMLVALERANLFIVGLDDRREWYRYHHLFADVLRARMSSEQPDEVSMLHRRASQWYEAQELMEEAVRHALAAGDVDRSARLVELALPALRRDRQVALLSGWLRALPEDAVRRSPVLSVFYGDMLMHSGDLEAVGSRLDDAERALAAVPDADVPPWPDTDELRTLPATIEIYRASLAQARGDATGTVAHARRALDLAGPDAHLARGGAAGFLGLAAWADGDVPSALETFAQAVASLHAAGNLLDELSGTVPLADMWLAAGRPSRARRLYARALPQAEARGEAFARVSATLHAGLAELDLEGGDLRSAEEHLQTAATLGGHSGMDEGRYRWFQAMGLLVRAGGAPDEAVTFLDQAAALYRSGFFPDVRPIAAITARTWIAAGRLAEAADWASDRGVSVADDASYLREFDHLSLVRLLLARQRADPDDDAADRAGVLLDRLRDAAQTSGRAGSLLEIGMLHALAHHARGRQAAALEQLAQAFAQAPEPEGYVRLFLDEGVPMTSLLRDAARHGIAGDHPRRLLSHDPSPDASRPEAGQGPVPLTNPLSGRELQVLRLLDSELSGPDIARELFVSHNTLRSHTKHIFTKLGVSSRRAAVLRAREHGLL